MSRRRLRSRTRLPSDVRQEGASGDVHTLAGNVTQDNSRNIVLYNNAFRLEVVRAAEAVSATRQQVRDDILGVLDSLMANVDGHTLSSDKAAALGQRLGTILTDAPISAYQLNAREFTLAPGTAYFLPGGENSFAYQGPAPDGTANAILVLRNGRPSTMRVGAVREFRQGAESCRLLLHHVAADFSAATFSFDCRS